MTFSRIPCWPAAYGPGKPNAPEEAMSLDLCESSGPWSTAWPWEPCCGGTLRDLGLCGAQGSCTKEDPSHTWCGLLSFTGTIVGWFSSDRILDKIKRRGFFVLFCFFLNPDIEDFRLWLVGPIDFVLWQGRAWTVWQRKTFYLMGAKTQRGMVSHHLLQRYVPRWHIITSLAPTSWCFCHHQITKPFTWDFGNIPDPNSNT